MKEDAQNVSRRNFLTKSAAATAAVVTASILVIETPAETGAVVGENCPVQAAFNCNQAQTLTNKIIPSISNILGTDYVNVREYEICGTDITDALNCAIDSLKNAGAGLGVPRGGQILIPRGRWTSRGGHKFYPSISIEGVGTQINPELYGVSWGTQIQLVPGANSSVSSYMFMIDSGQHNCSLKNMSINLGAHAATGLLMTNDTLPRATDMKHTNVQNVTFYGGDYGIKVDSKPDSTGYNPNFECILNHFERVSFTGCKTSFYCNTINSGFLIDTCYFMIPENGIALELQTIGNISVEHCLIVPSAAQAPNSTVLKTVGAFNSISFYDCQDENISYAYQNDANPYDYISVVYRNCLIQSIFKFNSHGSVVLDSCRVGSWDTVNGVFVGGAFIDSAIAAAKVYLKGQYNFYRWAPTIMYLNAPIATFNNAASKLIFESNEVGTSEIFAATAPIPTSGYYVINKTRGLINIDSGANSILVYNNLVNEDSIIFAQLHTSDAGGARIREVQCHAGYFYINLSANASNKLRVAFKVEI